MRCHKVCTRNSHSTLLLLALAVAAAEAVQVDPALAYALAKEDAGTIGYQGGYHAKEGDVEAAAEAASIPSDLNEPC